MSEGNGANWMVRRARLGAVGVGTLRDVLSGAAGTATLRDGSGKGSSVGGADKDGVGVRSAVGVSGASEIVGERRRPRRGVCQ